MASAALMAGSVMSTGGMAAFALKMVRRKKVVPKDNSKNTTERRNDDGNDERRNDERNDNK
jgi:hypothetical protein